MTENPIEILLVEDTPCDVALTLHAFKHHQMADRVHVVRDGAEALEFVFCTGAYAQRDRTRSVLFPQLRSVRLFGVKASPHTPSVCPYSVAR